MLQFLRIRNRVFEWGKRTYIMGILNVTPDSFSDGGEYYNLDDAIAHALEMEREGADIIDIGGQSTRPGATTIPLEEELSRVIPVISSLRQHTDIPISIDTTRAIVAEKAIQAGADIINDISGATYDPQMLPTAASLGVPIILMHIRGTPQTMQSLTDYRDLIGEIKDFLLDRISQAIKHGIKKEHIILDPGLGFAKDYSQNLEIIRKITEFKQLGFPLLIGPSRKSFIGKILQQEDPKKRVWGTAAVCSYAIIQGVDIIRVHDVKPMCEVAKVTDTLFREGETNS
ncbi:MAG: dihydropteroate synthase [Geminocystis sp.]|nr:dihydropteroate synthase [Geminocystis sp.]HIK37421.1 dihydropteroate synthase [Geminocystis sp. M7585_C2015_104]